jgi:hypothetical protein
MELPHKKLLSSNFTESHTRGEEEKEGWQAEVLFLKKSSWQN